MTADWYSVNVINVNCEVSFMMNLDRPSPPETCRLGYSEVHYCRFFACIYQRGRIHRGKGSTH